MKKKKENATIRVLRERQKKRLLWRDQQNMYKKLNHI